MEDINFKEEKRKIKFHITQTTNLLTDLEKNIKEAQQKLDKLLEIESKIVSIHTIICPKNDSDSEELSESQQSLYEDILDIKNQASQELQNVQELQEKITESYENICGEDNDENLLIQIESARNEASEDLGNLQNNLNKLSLYYDKVFGKEENNQKGLKQELEEYEKTMKTKFKEWEKEIQDLLGKATNASLASSYRESRESYEESIRVWNGLFIACMIALFLVAITMDFQKIDLSNPYAILSLFLARIPFFIPFIWLAIFSTRRRNEIKRLQEEYRHKETIAKSYSGYKEQIGKVGDDDGKLAKQLMENLVAMTNDNPNKALDKIKQENTPSLELLEKIGELPKEIQEAITPSLLEKFLKLKK